jgi:hypothetical protein
MVDVQRPLGRTTATDRAGLALCDEHLFIRSNSETKCALEVVGTLRARASIPDSRLCLTIALWVGRAPRLNTRDLVGPVCHVVLVTNLPRTLFALRAMPIGRGLCPIELVKRLQLAAFLATLHNPDRTGRV